MEKKVIWRQQWCFWQCYYGVIKDISDEIFIKATNFILFVIFHESNWSRKPPIGHHRTPWNHQYPKTVNSVIGPYHSSKTFMSVKQSMSTFCRRQINMSSNQRSHAVKSLNSKYESFRLYLWYPAWNPPYRRSEMFDLSCAIMAIIYNQVGPVHSYQRFKTY